MAGSPPQAQSQPPASSAREAAAHIVGVLRRNGFVAYLAGGCVRDEVMGLTPKDYDVATDARPERVRRLFRNTQAVGEHFGVILVRERDCTVEVATFRQETGYADRRRPDAVAFTDARTDAHRRDFTINGLFRDPFSGEVIDYVGGQEDIRASIIRAIGDPEARLSEDHLRALRAVRFAARFGFTIESGTADAIAQHASELRGVSRERIGQEIRLMLLDPHRGQAVEWLTQLKLDAPVLDEPGSKRSADHVARLQFGEGTPGTTVLVAALAAWAVGRASAAPEISSTWRNALVLSNEERDGLRAVLRDLPRLQVEWPGLGIAARKRLAAGSWFDATIAVLAAVVPRVSDRVLDDVKSLSSHAGGLAPAPLVTGDDLVAAGFAPGPRFKGVLEEVYDQQLSGTLDSRPAAIAAAVDLLSE